MMYRGRPCLSTGFTLVELLVVLTVLGGLFSLLAPAIGGVRSSGRQAHGASNLRQLVLSLQTYALDHKQRYAPGAQDMAYSSNMLRASENLHRWHGVRADGYAPFRPHGGSLTPYLGGSDSAGAVGVCPAFKGVLSRLEPADSGGENFEAGCGGYGYNQDYVGVERRWLKEAGTWVSVTDHRGSLRSRFKTPAWTVAFADAARVDEAAPDGVVPYSFAHAPFHAHSLTRDGVAAQRIDSSIHFRHPGQKANVAWLDGRVSAESATRFEPYADRSWFGGPPPVDPEPYKVGAFGKDDDNSLFDYE